MTTTFGDSNHEARHRFENELAKAGVSPQQWRHYQLARHFCRFSEMDRRQRAKLDRPGISQAETYEEDANRGAVQRALSSLHPRHAQILKLRYGFGRPECTLQEIADMLGLTKERIRQLQLAAEKKLIGILLRLDRHGDLSDIIDSTEHEQGDTLP